MSIFEDTNPRDLKELLLQIHTGEAALPDFQRSFVWDPKATQELIISVASGYPAGSLLRILNTRDYFKPREVAGTDPLKRKPTYLILDGQQRLTSLYQVFYGKGEYRYYLRIGDLIDGTDFDDAIFHVRVNARRGRDAGKAKRYAQFEIQARELILPLSVVFGKRYGFGHWADDVAETTSSDSERRAMKDKLREVGETWIKNIEDYQFPVVTLSGRTPDDAVCTIFETLNRTGVKLTAFDLLTARVYPKKVGLREWWDTAQNEYPIIADFNIDPYYLLQACALLKARSCKRSDVLKLQADDIREFWTSAVEGMTGALKLLREGCGVLVPDWLPYATMLVPMSAIAIGLRKYRGPQQGANRQKILRWFWCSVFGQTYESAANSQSAKDFTEVRAWMAGKDEPESVRDFKFDPLSLLEVTPRQRAVYRGVTALILRNQPRDFHNAAPLTPARMKEEKIEDHHVFPKGWFKEHKMDETYRDCVLNRTLIDRTTNARLGKRPPSDYLQEIAGHLENQTLKEMLESHLLPSNLSSPLMKDGFDDFLLWRQDAIANQISLVTGLSSKVRVEDEPRR